VLAALAALVALQKLDTAADTARKRLADMPAVLDALDAKSAAAAAAAGDVKARLAANQEARRALERDVAGVDTRMARFNDHKASVKTNQEYTALLHEIETAKTEKDALEERILILMEEADGLATEMKAAEAGRARSKDDAEAARATLGREQQQIEEELARLAGARKGEVAGVEAAVLARYEQLLKGRKGLAVAAMVGETCSACFVRLRPHVTQQIRRNDSLVTCESCQRILYWEPPAA
jgi:hypothetical protein